MNLTIASPELKRLVKRLAPVNSETTVFNPVKGLLYASDPDLTILIEDPLLQAPDAEELDGPVSLNSHQFSSVVSKTSGPVTFAILGNQMVVKSKRATFEIPTSYPKYSTLADTPELKYTIPFAALQDVLAFASTGSDLKERHNFTGSVQLRALTGVLSAVATDHRKIAMAEVPVTVQDFCLLCPVVVVQALRSLGEDDISIGETPSSLFFKTKQVTIIGRKLVKPFPGYKHLIPTAPELLVEIDAEALAESLDNVSPMVSEDEQGIRKLRMVFMDGCLRLYTSSGAAKSEDTTDCLIRKPDEMWAGFDTTVDHRAVSEFFARVKGTVIISGTNGKAPLLFTSGNHRLLVTTLKEPK